MDQKALTPQACREVLRDICGLELSCYRQEQLLRELRSKTAQLQHSVQVLSGSAEKPPRQAVSTPVAVLLTLVADLILALSGCTVGGLAGLLVRFVGGAFGFRASYLYCAAAGAVAGYVIAYVILVYRHRKNIRANAALRQDFPNQLAAYERHQAEKQALIDARKAQIEALPARIEACERELGESRSLLEQLYALDALPMEYRGLVPACTVWSYVKSGRCTTAARACAQYDADRKTGAVFTSLEVILENPDSAGPAQQAIVSAVRRSDQSLESLHTAFEETREGPALDALLDGAAKDNAAVRTRLQKLQA